jgi:hypothetical protein
MTLTSFAISNLELSSDAEHALKVSLLAEMAWASLLRLVCPCSFRPWKSTQMRSIGSKIARAAEKAPTIGSARPSVKTRVARCRSSRVADG